MEHLLARSLSALAFASGILLLVLVDALARAASAPPAPLPADAPPERFSQERARAAHARVFRDVPHPVGSAEHAAVRERLLAELRALGCEPLVEEGLGARNGVVARVRNVVVPPERRSRGEAVLVCAHYDSVAAGPGASDDGAGVAAMLEMLRALRASPPASDRPVIWLFDDAEELGLLGAQAFVESSPFAADVGVVVNLEARGTCGESRMFETTAGDARLIEVLRGALERPSASSISQEIYRRMPNDTDLTVFAERGWAGFNFAFIGGGRRYHTALDDLAHLDPATLQHQGDNALALVRALAAESGALAASSDTTYCDVLGRSIVAWPASLSPLVAALALAAIALAARRALRSGAARARTLLEGAACALAAPLCAVLLAWPADAYVAASRAGVYPWPPPSESGAARAFVVAAACAGALLAHACVARPRESATAHGLGYWIAHALGGVLCALWIQGGTYFFVLGAFAAAALAWSSRGIGSAHVAGAAANAVVWCPFLAGIEDVFELRTLGVPAVLAIAAAWAWLLAPFCGLVAEWPRRARLAAALLALALAAVAFAATLAEPSQTRDEPQPVKLAQLEIAGEERSTLLASAWSSRAFAPWLREHGFSESVQTLGGWLGRFGAVHARAAPPLALAPPELVELARASEPSTSARRRVSLRSPRGARQLVLAWQGGGFVELRSGGAERRLATAGRVVLAGFGSDEIELALDVALAADAAPSWELFDVSAAESGPLRELARALPDGFTPRGEGAVTVLGRRGTFER